MQGGILFRRFLLFRIDMDLLLNKVNEEVFIAQDEIVRFGSKEIKFILDESKQLDIFATERYTPENWELIGTPRCPLEILDLMNDEERSNFIAIVVYGPNVQSSHIFDEKPANGSFAC